MRKFAVFLITVFSVLTMFNLQVMTFAKGDEISVAGKEYELDEKSRYDYTALESSHDNTCGSLLISGNVIADGQKNKMPSYKVSAGNAALTYTFSGQFPVADSNAWNLSEDKGKNVAGITLTAKVGKGALVIQTSIDGDEWNVATTIPNALAETQLRNFYTTNNMQLTNGCYYRVIAAYQIERPTGQKRFFILNDFEEKKFVEVYEFYLHGADSKGELESVQSKALGYLTKADKNKGYSGDNAIKHGDSHYGWEMGHFFVSGYTRETKDENGTPVFLKNVGDRVTLWFRLEQNINALNGSDTLNVADDDDGYDAYFQTAKMNMERGALIIRHTDEKSVWQKPVSYTNYLAATASADANTVVHLCEEGDYEVALDYKIKKAPRKIRGVAIVPEYSDYRIFLKFSVRNGNCMAYPFDVVTGAELPDKAITPNGFKLDMARSRYLTIDVKHAILIKGEQGYTEDERFNRPAKDGEQYKDEGIYTFSVKNLYTGESTVKTIYVGSSHEMKALVANGGSVDKLNAQLNADADAQAAFVKNDSNTESSVPSISPTNELFVGPSVPSQKDDSIQDANANLSSAEKSQEGETPESETALVEKSLSQDNDSVSEQETEDEQSGGIIQTLLGKFGKVVRHR